MPADLRRERRTQTKSRTQAPDTEMNRKRFGAIGKTAKEARNGTPG